MASLTSLVQKIIERRSPLGNHNSSYDDAASAGPLFDKLDGKSLAGVFADPGRAPPADDAAFSQYIRCHNESQPEFDNDNLCASDQDPPPPGIITIMVRVCAFLLQT